jgi:hypothetical protein
LEDFIQLTHTAFDAIRTSRESPNRAYLAETHEPNITRYLFSSVVGSIKATRAEKILLNVEIVALQLANHMKVRNNFMILKPGTEIWITGRMGFP